MAIDRREQQELMRNLQSLHRFQADCRVAEIHRNISRRAEQMDDLQLGIRQANCLEEEVSVDGEILILFHLEGEKEGVAVDPKDLENGTYTREQIGALLYERKRHKERRDN